MNNIINDINNVPNLKFIKDVIKFEYIDKKTKETLIEHKVVIKLINLNNGFSRIYPYTEFINQWANRSTKYKCNIAGCLVKFLNFIYFGVNKKVLDNISDLTLDIGIEFLNECSKNCSKETLLHYERVLTNFYYFLAEKNILTHIDESSFIFIEKNKKLSLLSPFDGKVKKFNNKKKKENLHNLDFEFIFPFLETALEYEPSIALGIYFQIFGGLRASEVISIEYSNISVRGSNGFNGMTIELATKDLRPDIKTGFINGVKKDRKQRVVGLNGILSELYKIHKSKYKTKECTAVFINQNNLPMTYSNYRYRFNKVKKIFIEKLRNSKNPNFKAYSLVLDSRNWSTHIGRGIFSNLASEVAENAIEIAVMRGDSNLNSAITYITDTNKIEQKLVELMNKFYNDLGDYLKC